MSNKAKFPRLVPAEPKPVPTITLAVTIPQPLLIRTLAAIQKDELQSVDAAIARALDDFCGIAEVVMGKDGEPIGMIKHDEHGNPVGIK